MNKVDDILEDQGFEPQAWRDRMTSIYRQWQRGKESIYQSQYDDKYGFFIYKINLSEGQRA